MATAMPGVGMTILPQFQGDALRVQRQQALAQALMQQSMLNQGDQMNQIGAGMRVMPRVSPFQPFLQAAQGYFAGKLGDNAIDSANQLGRNQMNFLTGDGQPPQAPPQVVP